MFTSVCFLITSKCNLKCPYCYRIDSKREFIHISDYRKTLFLLKNMGTRIINITGGEPLLHSDWKKCINISYELGFETNLLTNTTMLDLNDEILDKLNLLSISCDGVENHDNRNRTEAQYKKSLSIIKEFNKNNYSFRLKVNTVVTKTNIAGLEKFACEFLDNSNIVWMLFPYKRKGKYNTMSTDLEVGIDEFENLLDRLLNKKLKCHIMIEHSKKNLLNESIYCMVNADADIFISAEKVHGVGNILNEDIDTINNRVNKLGIKYEFVDFTRGGKHVDGETNQ